MKKVILIILLLSLFFALAGSVKAIDTIVKSYPELPGAPEPTAGIPQYIRYIFVFSLGVVGIIAFVAMLMAAFGYVTSVGNPQKAAAAKDKIFSALLGMLILFASYLLLNTINPDLLKFKTEIVKVGDKVVIGVPPEEGRGGCRLTGAYWDKPEINIYPGTYVGSSESDKIAATATVTFELSKDCKDETYHIKPWLLAKTPHLRQIETEALRPVDPHCDGYFYSAEEVPVEEDENRKFSWRFTFYKRYSIVPDDPNSYTNKRCGGSFHTTEPADNPCILLGVCPSINYGISDTACNTPADMICNLRHKEGGQPEIFYLEGSIQLKEDLPIQYVPRQLRITVNDLNDNGICCR